MLVQQKGDLQLGAYAIGAGDQNGAGHTGQIGGELAAEVTDAAQDAILAAQMLAISDAEVHAKLVTYKSDMEETVLEKDAKLQRELEE